MNTQYLTDEGGRRIAVVLPVQEFEELMEDISDLAAVAERRGEERVPLAAIREVMTGSVNFAKKALSE